MGGQAKTMARRAGLRSKSNVAAVGGVRDTQARSARQVTKRKNRLRDGRVATSLAEAAQQREALDRRLAYEAEHPAEGPAPGAQYRDLTQQILHGPDPVEAPHVEVHETFSIRLPSFAKPYDGDGKCDHSIAYARSMVRQGYHAAKVMRTTGVGFKWIEDLVNESGYWNERTA